MIIAMFYEYSTTTNYIFCYYLIIHSCLQLSHLISGKNDDQISSILAYLKIDLDFKKVNNVDSVNRIKFRWQTNYVALLCENW